MPYGVADDTPVFVISVAAQLSGLHPQTLRQYDRMGLVSPGRTSGGGRRYSARNIAQLREVQRLSGLGVGLEGVRRILELENEVAALQHRVAELEGNLEGARAAADRAAAAVHASYRRDLVPVEPPGAVLVWRPDAASRPPH
ncbi:MAG: helix-turn-helix transcriptional regulator [Actinomycetota bacterium]|nr:helix-turn-helix transcriptional regulator [Actinomycetota bacterium]